MTSFDFILAEKASFPVSLLCDVLDVSRSGFYAWLKRPAPKSASSDARLAIEIRLAHQKCRRIYGSPRIHRELVAHGHRVGRKRVERLMRENGLKGCQKRRFRRTTDSKHPYPIAPNLLDRNFKTETADTTWVTDVTYVETAQGWLYLAVLLDLFSRRVVGWATSATNDRFLAIAALEKAVAARRPAPGLVHHSDRGSPYASDDYVLELRRHGMVQSMSRRGDCYDNAVAESFFATLRAEHLNHLRFSSRAAAVASLNEYIDSFYNPTRRHSTLDYVSPIEFELKSIANQNAA